MRLAASVPGGMPGNCGLSVIPSHQRSSAPRLAPTLIATIAFHMAGPCTVTPERRATVRGSELTSAAAQLVSQRRVYESFQRAGVGSGGGDAYARGGPERDRSDDGF